jgi:hypothetical protein
VEKKFRRSLTDDEWAAVAPDWFAPYDDQDVAELIEKLRNTSAQRHKPSAEEKARQHRRSQVEWTARQAQEMVEKFRVELFGHKEPPFPNQLAQAAQWIEAQAQAQGSNTQRFYLKVIAPRQLDEWGLLVWVRDYLTDFLSRYSAADSNDGGGLMTQFLNEASPVLRLGYERPILNYMTLNPASEIEFKCVYAPDGTLLGQLQSRAEEVAKATNWEACAAVHHLLTGGLVSPPAVQTTSHIRAGSQYFGHSYPITLVVPDPASVTEKDVTAAFQTTRSHSTPPWNRGSRQRGRVASKAERVAMFVKQTPGMTWADQLEEWNRRNPNDRFRTDGAIKKAYSRANRH